MIKIKRASCPKVLKGSRPKGTHYNKKKVVETLWKMQHEKCCYCEQKVPKKGHLKAVEHFYPKSVYKNRRNDWKNLLLACAQCNGQKSDRFPTELTDNSGEAKVLYQKRNSRGQSLIIDPSDTDVDPEDHIDFVVDDAEDDYGIPMEKCHSALGRTTIKTIGLDGEFYTKERRYFHTKILCGAYLLLLEARDGDDQEMWKTARYRFAMLLSANGRFAAYARAFARHKRVNEKFGIRIPVGAELAGDVLGADCLARGRLHSLGPHVEVPLAQYRLQAGVEDGRMMFTI